MKCMNDLYKVKYILKIAWKSCGFSIVFSSVIIFLISMLSFVINIINKYLVNELMYSVKLRELTHFFLFAGGLYIVCFFLQQISGFFNAMSVNFLRFKIDYLFNAELMKKSNRIKQDKLFDSSFMDNYSYINGTVGKISEFINSIIYIAFSSISTVGSSVIIFAIYDPLLIFYLLIILLVYAISMSVISKKEYELSQCQIKGSRKNDYYTSLLTTKENAKDIRINLGQEFLFSKWRNNYSVLREERLALDRKQVFYDNITSILVFMMRTFAIVMLLFGVLRHQYDIGTFTMLFGITYTCNKQINGMMYNIMNGTYKNNKYLCDYYDFVYEANSEQEEDQENNEQAKEFEFQQIVLKDVFYRYPNSQEYALKHISFRIDKGEIVSILGYNGSGKTTLSKIILGALQDYEGDIYINGEKADSQAVKKLCYHIGILPQEISHYSVTIEDYVGLGNINAKRKKEVEKAYEKAEIKEWITNYSEGEETILGKEYEDKGVELSGGEWQRLALAASYMGSPNILIMDEPTASIDPIREQDMLNNLKKNLNGKTAILISHRIAFARLADRIIVMKKGQILEEGTHEELIRKKGDYFKLYDKQKQLYEKSPYFKMEE